MKSHKAIYAYEVEIEGVILSDGTDVDVRFLRSCLCAFYPGRAATHWDPEEGPSLDRVGVEMHEKVTVHFDEGGVRSVGTLTDTQRAEVGAVITTYCDEHPFEDDYIAQTESNGAPLEPDPDDDFRRFRWRS
jgi:hypothetical protein